MPELDWRCRLSPLAILLKLIHRLQRARFWERKPLVGLVSYLRWAIPIAVSFVGIGYMLLENVVLQGHSLTEPTVLRTVVVIGLAGPVLVWLSLTWAAHAAMAEAQAQQELALRNEEARRRLARLQVTSEIGQRMAGLLDLQTLLSELTRLIRARFGYDHAYIWLMNAETQELVLKEAHSPQADEIKAYARPLPIDPTSIVGWVAHTGKTLLCNDVAQDARYTAMPLTTMVRAELAVPLFASQRIIGVLDIQNHRLNSFLKEDVVVLEILGNQLGIAIENARLFQETKRRYEAMIALHETSLDIIAQLNREDLLQALLRRSVQLLGASASALYLYETATQEIRHIAGYNTTRDWRGITLRLGEGVIGHVIQNGMPLIVNEYDRWRGRAQVFVDSPYTRIIGIPLRWRKQILGGITVMNPTTARPFDGDDIWLLSMFADLATIAIKNSDLHTEIKNFNQRLEQKVAERTHELSRAQEEILAKTEQLRSLLAKTIDLQENERARIARDMHDGVVQLITAARLELQAARVIAGEQLPALAQSKMSAARQVLEEAEMELRRAIYDLHSPILDALGLVPALEKHARRFYELTGVTCTLLVQGTPYRLAIATEVAVFRMIEEALNNVAAHSGGTAATIQLDYKSEVLCISVKDNGQGFDFQHWASTHHHGHLGLLGMQERASTLGGQMAVRSEPGQGTELFFRLPITPAEL